MQKKMMRQADGYVAGHRRRIWQGIVGGMACAVVFCTTYVLILPAITMEKYDCGITEHTHTEACYTRAAASFYREPVCTLESLDLHEHDADCYDENGAPVCGYADFVVHEHDESCYDEDGELWCPLPEIEAHTHNEGCYVQWPSVHIHDDNCYIVERGELICTESEEDAHIHDDSCYTEREELVCGQEESDGHQHDDSCYDEAGELICGMEESEGHTHGADCYETSRELTCWLPEETHRHTDECYEQNKVMICGFSADPEEDGGTEQELICVKEEIILHTHKDSCFDENGTLICGKLEVLEHVHSVDCFQTVETASDADVLTCTIPEGEGAHTHSGDCYDGTGELICGIEESEGHQHSALCYGTWELTCGKEEHTHTDACTTMELPDEPSAAEEIVLCLDSDFDNGRISANFHIEGTATLPEMSDADAEPDEDQSAETQEMSMEEQTAETDISTKEQTAETEAMPEAAEPVILITELDSDNADYQRIVDASQSDDLLDLSVVQVEVYCNDQKLDLSGCTITAEVSPTEQLMETLQDVCIYMEEDIAPEAEMGIVFAALESDGITEQTSAFVLPDTPDTPILTTSVGSDGIMTVAVSQAANPKFKVQYYAYLDAVAAQGEATIDSIIDTSGGNLPANGTVPTTKSIGLTSADGGKYKVATLSTLTQVYSEHEYEYITAPNLSYFNRLYENGSYELKEIWILKGKDSSSTSEDDWDVYDPSKTHFTNREASASESTVLITDDTVIRLVFDTTNSTYTNAVNFYDYDITNDGTHTAAQGINSALNYTGSGAKLAFGNANTGTGLDSEQWNGNTLNCYNHNGKGYQGCTFGLASSLVDGRIQYASGVTVPNLFNDGAAAGKTSYDNGQYTLSFNRAGDTYTLSAVNGAGVTGLEYFNHPAYPNQVHTSIWTNNFWPMDSKTNIDPHTGQYNNRGTFIGVDGEKTYPPSDDSLSHNSMFGMQYAVQFTLTEDYVGPLEYYFFGDDDMWVFLDGRLVCDIGGVHSSVGEYVNLWDYLDQNDAGTHTLTFYYTERGLSGSTCYMQFTLPSVSSVTPEQNTGLLTVQKKVEGVSSSDEEFHFSIKFTDQDGNELPDDYSYTRYAADGTVVKKDVIIFDGGSFELKDDEYVVINYLPYGSKYTITETDLPYYTVTYTVNSGAPQEGTTAGGQITTGTNGTVVFTNTAKPMLPETGGSGITPYTTGGLLFIGAGLILLYKDKKRRKEDSASS